MSRLATRKQYIFGVTIVVLSAIGLYGLLPRLGNFAGSWDVLGKASLGFALLAVVASLLSSLVSAMVYKALSFKPLGFVNTGLVQLSGLFINKILPAGIGGLGLNFLYLRKQRHSAAQATVVVAVNNLLGLVGHATLVMALLIGYAVAGRPLTVEIPTVSPIVWQVLAGVLAAALIGSLLYRRLRPKQSRKAANVFGHLVTHYAHRPNKLLIAIGLSAVMTLCNVLSFWLCCQALNIEIGFLPVMLIFTIGIIAGTATPTPGGLGGIEAGLTAGLVSQGVSAELGLATALLYRFASYWFGLVLGAVMFALVQRRRLLATV